MARCVIHRRVMGRQKRSLSTTRLPEENQIRDWQLRKDVVVIRIPMIIAARLSPSYYSQLISGTPFVYSNVMLILILTSMLIFALCLIQHYARFCTQSVLTAMLVFELCLIEHYARFGNLSILSSKLIFEFCSVVLC